MTNEPGQKIVLIIIIAILLLANTITLIMLFTQRSGHKNAPGSGKGSMAAYLKKDVGYGDAQIARFDSLHKDHMKNVEGMFSEMRIEKEKRFKYLTSQDFGDSAIEVAGNMISEKQKALELRMLRHLRDVRNIGTPEQRVRFDSTFVKYISEKENKKKH